MKIFCLALGEHQTDGRKAQVNPWLAHPDCTIGYNLAKRWRDTGHEVCNHPDPQYAGVDIADYFDATFLFHPMHGDLWHSLCPDWPYRDKPSACLLHECREDWHKPNETLMRMFEYLPVTHTLAQQTTMRHSPHGHVFVMPWPSMSSWEWPPSQPNPYTSGKPIVWYCGTMQPNALMLLGEVASLLPEMEVHFTSFNINDRTIFTDAPPHGAIEMEDIPDCLHYHPAMAHTTFSQYYWYADVAIDVPKSENQLNANCKNMDYLAAGLPIVGAGWCAGMETARELGRLKVAPFCDAIETARLIRETVAAGWREPLRQLSRDYIRTNHTSNIFADRLARLFANHVVLA